MTTSRSSLTLAAAALGALCLAAPTVSAQDAPDADPAPEARPLPGYYQWYKHSGAMTRIEDEIARDRAMEAGDEWSPVHVGRSAPDWSFPTADGQLVPLRVGGEGRNTLVVTFQSWW